MHKKILIIAGAGMSADSQLSTYQTKHDLWSLYPYYKIIGKDYRAIANANLFKTDPTLAWGFYASQIELYDRAIPHKGYLALLNTIQQEDYFVVTTNVDNLFLKAGFDPMKVHCAHGSIFDLQCSKPCSQETWQLEKKTFDFTPNEIKIPYNEIPICQKCGAIARPNIFMPGDHLHSYVETKNNLQAMNFMQWLSGQADEFIVIEIGVGGEGLRRHAMSYCQQFPTYRYIVINPIIYTLKIDVIYLQGKAIDMVPDLQLYI